MEEKIELTIDHLSLKGHGVAYFRRPQCPDPLKVEIPFGLPGEVVSVLLGRKRRKQRRSSLLEILTSSAVRTSPRCAHATVCGGCTWQQMDYSAQLLEKQNSVEKAFAPWIRKGTLCAPIIACETPWEYRNKMEFSFSQNKEGEKFLGLMISQSKGRVLNLRECHLVSPWFSAVLEGVRNWWMGTDLKAYHMYSDTGSLRTLILREGKQTGEKMAFLTVSGNPEYRLNKNHIEGFCAAVKQALSQQDPERLSIFLRIQQAVKGSPTQFYEWHLKGPDHIKERLDICTKNGQTPLLFKISPTSFFQPNTLQAQRLYSHALQMVELPSKALVYDLYCGTATLGMITALQAEKVIGIELNPHAVFDAQANKQLNGVENLELICGDVGKVLKELSLKTSSRRPDLAIIDPPRAGLDQSALEQLIQLSPKEILYISCNPSTQAENIKVLCENGFVLTRLQPVDQFPHTVHIENIAVLKNSLYTQTT